MPVRPFLLPSATIALLALPAMGAAQARAGNTRDTIPVQMLPPAGKCRIWMEGVPAAQQPAPTDCATALRQKPANGVLLYGPAQRDGASGRFDPNVGSAPGRTAKPTEKPADGIDNAGSAAEQELKRRREREERARRLQEIQEREQRAQREAADRLILGDSPRRGGTPGSVGGSSDPRTATPRGSTTGNSTAGGTGSSTKAPEAPAKPPAEPTRKKPE